MDQRSTLKESVRRELALAEPGAPRRLGLLGVTAVFLSWSAFGGLPLLAQEPYRQELIPNFSTLDAGNFSSPALADLDGDGDFDAAVGSRLSSELVYFENIGSSNMPVFVQQNDTNPFASMNAGIRADPELADLDGDGDFDAAIGGNYGTVLFFENVGSSSAPAFIQRTGSGNPFEGIDIGSYSSPDLADLDGDLDLDLAIGVSSGSVRYFANTGSAPSARFVERTGSANPLGLINADITVGYLSKPELADLDGDGDLDAVAGLQSGSLRYYQNTGTSTAPAFVQRTGTANPIVGPVAGVVINSDPQLADLDGDGDLDLLSGEKYGSLHFLENTGSIGVPILVTRTGSVFLGIDFSRYAAPERADLDGDGDLDLVVGSYGVLRYLENTGSAILFRLVERTGSANPFSGLAAGLVSHPNLADLDGDGDLDALIGERSGSVRFIENSGSAAFPAFLERFGSANPCNLVDVGSGATPELVDTNGDGDLDLLLGESSGRLPYFENTGSSSAPAFVERIGSSSPFAAIDIGSRSSPDLADLDSDGDLDLAVASNLGLMKYFENTGNSSIPALVERTGSANPLEYLFDESYGDHPELADVDGDGDLDLLLGESAGRIHFYRSLAIPEPFFADGFESGDTSGWSGP